MYLLKSNTHLRLINLLTRYCTVVFVLSVSCKSYQANILFEVSEEEMEELSNVVVEAQSNYLVSPHDHLEIDVYTNKGEELVDPHNAINRDQNINQETASTVYVVKADGSVDLPIIGNVQVVGMTIAELEMNLVKSYTLYYKEPFVQARYVNKRVIVLGATDGKVISLSSEGMNLLEVLALAGGVDNDARGNNIRLIRGDLSNPQVQVIDLSTINGMAKANLEIQPNDIIYVEPVRRPFTEGLRDIVPILSLLTSVLALVVAFTN